MASDDRQETTDDIIESMERFANRHWMHDEGQAVREFANRIKAAWKRDEECAVEHATRHAEAVARDNCRDCIHNPNGKNYEPVGNAAAMREALENIAEYAKTARCHTDDAHVLGYLEQIEKWAKDALSEPPRQCDVGTEEEQTTRYRKFCFAHRYLGSDFSYTCKGFGKGRCPFFKSHTKSQCEFAWAQTPYAAELKGGAEC